MEYVSMSVEEFMEKLDRPQDKLVKVTVNADEATVTLHLDVEERVAPDR